MGFPHADARADQNVSTAISADVGADRHQSKKAAESKMPL